MDVVLLLIGVYLEVVDGVGDYLVWLVVVEEVGVIEGEGGYVLWCF